MLVFGLPTAFFTLLIMAASSRLLSTKFIWAVIFLLGILTSLLPFYLIRQILFVGEVVIRRHFLPDQFIGLHEFGGVIGDSVLASGKRIRIRHMENLDELSTAARRWSAARTMEKKTPKPERSKPVYPTAGYGPYASFWGLIFGVISIFVLPDILPLDPRWILGGTFLSVYLIYIYVLPRLI